MRTPKMLKVTFMGEPLKNIYPHCTRWELFKYRSAKFMRKVLIVAFVIGVGVGGFQLHRITVNPIYVKAEDTSQALFDAKIESLKDGVVNELLACEGAGYNEDSGLVTYDPTDAQYNNLVNGGKRTITDKGEMSYGILQFKKSTVITYTKLMSNRVITGKEALLIALDKNESSKLAKFVMFETKAKASGDWKNCEKKLNLDDKIDVIKQISK